MSRKKPGRSGMAGHMTSMGGRSMMPTKQHSKPGKKIRGKGSGKKKRP